MLLAIDWIGDVSGCARLIDQTLLPTEVKLIDITTPAQMWEAIKMLRVRGAPAIGVAAGMGFVLGIRHCSTAGPLRQRSKEIADYLRTSRPTAVNLFWALDRMEATLASCPQDMSVDALKSRLLEEAQAIQTEDRQTCREIGSAGASLIPEGGGVLTHCNAGGLATAEYGTALAVMFRAAEEGRMFQVFADETRPLLQGARLTTWELQQAGIDVTLICDNMAAQVMKEGRIQVVITGADRIAANGDAANKIGTYGVAVLARAHGIPFYVAAPASTFDFALASGDAIPIEQRDPAEITHGMGRIIAPEGVAVYNPAFDVTPNHLIDGLITEKGIIRSVNAEQIRNVLG